MVLMGKASETVEATQEHLISTIQEPTEVVRAPVIGRGEVLARARLHSILGLSQNLNPLPLVGEGKQSFVFKVKPKIVGKVDKYYTDDHARMKRQHFFENCKFFFGEDRVIPRFCPPQKGIVQAVHFQKNIAHILDHPDTVRVSSGYVEDVIHDENAYASVTEHAIMRKGKFDLDAFQSLYTNDHMKKLFKTLPTDHAFHERLSQLISQIMYLFEKIKKPVDCIAYDNILLHPEGNEWQYDILDPEIVLDKKLMIEGQKMLEYFASGGKEWTHDMHVFLVNFVDFVRFINGIADLLEFDQQERIKIGYLPVDWKELQWFLHQFIQRERRGERGATGIISTHEATIMQEL